MNYNKMRTREGGNIPPRECLVDLAVRRLVEKCLVVRLAATLQHPKIVESSGVITVQRSRASGLCAASDHASAQYPVIRCTLPRAQSRLH